MSPYAFTDIEIVDGSPKPSAGPGLLPFSILSTFFSLLAVIVLFRKLRRSDGIEKVQFRFVMLGMALMLGLVIFTVLIPVVFFKVNFFVSFIPIYALIFLALVAYTIVKHRFLEIRMAVARTLSFSFLIGSFVLIYSTLFIFAVPYLANLLRIQASIIAGIGALFAVLVARYVQEFLRRLTDRFLFQRQVDYRVALVKISRQMSQTIEMDKVNNILLETMNSLVRVTKVAIYLRDSSGGLFEPRAFSGMKKLNLNVGIPSDFGLIQHLRHTQQPVIKDEVAIAIEQEKKPEHKIELEKVIQAMEWFDVAAAIPLFVEKGLTGFILLGNKLSGVPFSKDDIEFLEALAPQAATALDNARLYREALEFGEKLKEEVKLATQELEVANEQLMDLDKAKSEFLSIASHQLYTPLTALRGYLSMLEEGDFGELKPEQKPVIDILNKSSLRLIDLIKNLLDISKIESGRLELNLESVDIVKMARDLVTDLLPNAKKKGLTLTFHEPKGKLAKAIVDSQRLRQVMLNFVDNAIKYTDEGRIDVSIKQEIRELVFVVKDTGKGIAEEEIRRLFHKFTRVGGSSRFNTEGTGLGLYVARQIMHEHHGEVSVISDGKDKGSSFFMRIPIEGSPRSLRLEDRASVVMKVGETEV